MIINYLKAFALFLTLLFLISCKNTPTENIKSTLQTDFVYLKKIVKNIDLDMRYFGNDNFMGKQVIGYQKEVCICTKQAANRIKDVQYELSKKGLSLRIFDSYRPQRSVDYFIEWSKNPADTLTKAKYYPNIKKGDLFKLKYLAKKSSHTRGSTFDLTILDSKGNELDMGTTYDYFGPESWPTSNAVTTEQKANRMLLQEVMLSNGFTLYPEEWWHFTLKDEPFPSTYFDFEIE